MAFRKKMSPRKNRATWKKGNKMKRRNLGVYTNRNRGGVRF